MRAWLLRLRALLQSPPPSAPPGAPFSVCDSDSGAIMSGLLAGANDDVFGELLAYLPAPLP
jgi:hypothetical protein